MIQFNNVHRSYRIPRLDSGLKGIFRHLFFPEFKIRRAVEGVSFSIKPGEAVGYVGANGAGKSTTIKMLLGILQPEAGEIRVMGETPAPLSDDLKRRIGVVFGQRSQLWWNLPVQDSLDLFSKMYHVPSDRAKKNIADLVERLDIGRLLPQPARQLSLGEKMRCELALACLHQPDLLVLDEPTIGLDVASRFRLREFLKERNRVAGTTIFLTTHDLGDILEVCGRIILLDRGKLLADDSVPALCRSLGNEPCLQFVFGETLSAEKILAMEDLVARIYTGLWNLETTGDFAAVIRFPGGQPLQIERVQRAFLDQFRISTCTFSESLPLESILRRLGNTGPLRRSPGDPGDGGEKPLADRPPIPRVDSSISGSDLLRKARHLRRRFSDDVAIHLVEVAQNAGSVSERLAVLLLLRGLEGGQERTEVLRRILLLVDHWNEAALQATLVRLVGLYGRMDEPGVQECMVRKLADGEPRVRANAVEAWGILGGSADSPEIQPLVLDKSPRVLANVALLRLNDSEFQGLEDLREMLRNTDTAEAAAYALRLFFESRPMERWFSRPGKNLMDTRAFLEELFRLEDLLSESLFKGGALRQRTLALASFPYSRGLASLIEAGEAFPGGVPKEEIMRLTGVKF